MLHGNKSEESLNTFVETCLSALGNNTDFQSVLSGETIDAVATPIFRNHILGYTILRELPIIAGTLSSELSLYASIKSLKNGDPPLLSTQLNKLHFIKKSAPIFTVFMHEENQKHEYCKIYFKILQNNLTCYVLMFTSGENVCLFNNALKPHCDTIYKDTKLRIIGASGASSTFGNAAIKMFLLEDSSPSLVDDMDDENISSMKSVKDLTISKKQKTSKLYSAVVRQKRNEVLQLISLAVPIAPIPFATFFDYGDQKIDQVKVYGSVRIFETPATTADAQISEDSLVLSTIMLTLIEQEVLKMRGNNKPSFV